MTENNNKTTIITAFLVGVLLSFGLGWFSKAYSLDRFISPKNIFEPLPPKALAGKDFSEIFFTGKVMSSAGGIIEIEKSSPLESPASKIAPPEAREKKKFDVSKAEVFRQGEKKSPNVLRKELEEYAVESVKNRLPGADPVPPPDAYVLEKVSASEIKQGDKVLVVARLSSSGDVLTASRVTISAK